MSEAVQILDRLKRHATDLPERVAVREIAAGRTITWSELDHAARDFADQLRADRPGSQVVILKCHNTINFHIAFLAAIDAGVTVLPVPFDIAPRELETAASKSRASAVIYDDLSIDRLESNLTAEAVNPAVFLQSSGTTGLPRIVRRDGRSIDAVASNCANAIGFTRDDQVLSCVPLCHSYGLEHGLLTPIFAGATTHLAQGFDINLVRRELRESGITLLPSVPSIYEMLGNLADDQSDFHTLRIAYSAGGPLPETVFEKVRNRLGIRVAQLYGATELGSITFAHPDDPAFDPASAGQPMAGVELRVDSDGQLHARSPSMMSNYVGDASPPSTDGFFPTGDLAQVDQRGNLHITGRIKFLIDVGGLKVNPLEVEQTLAQHPDVAACVVVPMRLSETLFRLKAIVTPVNPHRPPTSEMLRAFARENLSAHKIPRVFELRDALPRSATGKILRHLLVETA